MGIRIPISIQGLIIAASWTEKGVVAAVDIAGYDEKRYRVFNDHLGKQLLEHIKRRVAIDGFLDTGNGNQVLYVERFHIDSPNGSNPPVSGNTEK